MHLRIAALITVVLATACFSESEGPGGGGDDEGSSEASGTSLAPSTSATVGASTVASSEDGSDASGLDPETTGAAAVCGDGVPDDGEACDDGDDDELDGCTRACTLGPRGFALATVAAPAPAGAGTINVSLPCVDPVSPRPLLLGTLFGHRGGVSPDNAWTVSAGGGCSAIALVDGVELPAIELGPDPIELPEQGNTFMQVDTWSLACAAGASPIGIDARIFAGEVPYVASVRLQCGVLRLVEDAGVFSVAIDAAEPTAWTPTGTTHSEVSSMCPAGSVAVGFRGAIESESVAMYALGPLCATVDVLVGEG
jgi:cysteine-rich repeat protein